jgi:hypothetical protein
MMGVIIVQTWLTKGSFWRIRSGIEWRNLQGFGNLEGFLGTRHIIEWRNLQGFGNLEGFLVVT